MWSLLAMLLMTAITVVYPIILQITIDEIVMGRQYQLAAWVSLGFIVVMALKGIATFFHQYLGDMFGIKSVYRLRNGLYEKLQRLSFSYYDNAKTGDLMSRLTADVEGLRFSCHTVSLSSYDSACWSPSACRSCFTILFLLRL